MNILNQENKTKKSSVLLKIGKIIGYIILSILCIVVVVILLIQTSFVQDFGRKKIVSYLQTKLQTSVQIRKLDIDFPKMLVLEDVFIGDKKNDTLIAGHQLKVDLDMFKLLQSNIQINEIVLNGITTKIKRELPDTVFNFQFIADAFSSPKKQTDTASIQLAINKIIIDKSRIVYKDIVTGNDVDVYFNHLDTRISSMDLAHLHYDIPSITVDGVRGFIKQIKPIAITAINTHPDSTLVAERPAYFQLSNKETRLSNVNLFYSNQQASVNSNISFDNLILHPTTIDVKESVVSLKDIKLQGFNGNVDLGNNIDAEIIKLTTQTGNEINASGIPWKIIVDDINIQKSNFKYNDNTQAYLKKGMDYAHLDLKDFNSNISSLYLNNDTISAEITKTAFKEKSGFQLDELQAQFTYHAKGTTVNHLFVKTPWSTLQPKAVITYPSLSALQKNPALLFMNVEIEKSEIAVRDILYLVPTLSLQPILRNPNDKIYVDGKIMGTVNNLFIESLQIKGPGSLQLDAKGTIQNAMDYTKASGNLTINTLYISKNNLTQFAPKGSIPANITLPDYFSLSGKINGNMQSALAQLQLNTSLGSVKVKGSLQNGANKNLATYNMLVDMNNVDVGNITQQKENIGKISGSFTIKGKGYDMQNAAAVINGKVSSANIKNYLYKNIIFDAKLSQQAFVANAGIQDQNIHATLAANGFLNTRKPGFNVTLNIDSVKTRQLNLTPEPLYYRGTISARFPSFNIDALHGDVHAVNSVLVINGQRVVMDSLSFIAINNNNTQELYLNTDFLSATIKGEYKLTDLGNIFIQTIQPYYQIPGLTSTASIQPYNLTISALLTDHPTLHAFLPELKRLEPITINAALTSGSKLNTTITAPYILYGTNIIDNVIVNATSKPEGLIVNTSVNGIKSGTAIALYKTDINATIANNTIDVRLLLKDKSGINKYSLASTISRGVNNLFTLNIKPDSLLLNYNRWNINRDNAIKFGNNILHAQNFDLSQGTQHLIINSGSAGLSSPLNIVFQNFEISTLSSFALSDSLPVSGTVNGSVLLKDMLTQPNLETDLTLNNFSFRKDTVGDVNIKINNNSKNIFATNISLTGKGNEIYLNGNYYLQPGNKSNLDFELDIKQLPFTTIETFSLGYINQSGGQLTGKVKITGATTAPQYNGAITFNNTFFNVAMLGSIFKINDETIMVDNDGILFDSFTIRDSANNKLVVDGLAATNNFTNYKLDLNIHARNFRAINTTKRQNSLYYGQLYFNTNLSISGTESAPIIDGYFTVNDKTNLSVVVPQVEAGLVQQTGVIQFVDMDAPGNDSIFQNLVAQYDSSFNNSMIKGFDVAANIEVSKDAVLNIIIDEANGDFLRLKGEASLTGGIDPSGKITLTGTYEIESGAYELSFNLIKRKFDIVKGSKITWTGEPTTAIIDVSALYIANTSPLELVNSQISDPTQKGFYQQKLPFQVTLNVDGDLMKPQLTFDINLPKEGNLRVNNEVLSTVNTRLSQVKNEPSELNKQVFALLLLNRFVSENPFESSGSSGFDVSSYAKQSVSKLLTEQLNRLATDLISGVDISFDLNSEEDYTTGEKKQRTDFNVSLSKRLLNDRLKISVGSNYELEGPQQGKQKGTNLIGNLTVDYLLSQDGNYLLRGYRKNDFDYVLEGQVVETGLKFIISADYNKIRDLLKKNKQNQDSTTNNKKEKPVGMNNSPDNESNKQQNTSTPAKINLLNDERNKYSSTKDTVQVN